MNWWSKEYNRPLKDPILQSYNVYELLYEYHSKIEFDRAVVSDIEKQRDKIEEEQEALANAWADEMEAEEEEENGEYDPFSDPKNIEWMQAQLDKEKESRGDDFGDDFSIDFSE